VEGLPTTRLYDRQGILRKKVTGVEFTDTFDVDLKPFFDIRSGNITKKRQRQEKTKAEASSNKQGAEMGKLTRRQATSLWLSRLGRCGLISDYMGGTGRCRISQSKITESSAICERLPW
jgi:hypothetical protein